MYCRKCGQLLPSESAFCYKCGTEVKIIDEEDKINSDVNVENINESNTFVNNEYKIINVKKPKIKINKIFIILATILVLIVSVGIYNDKLNQTIVQSKKLYLQGRYSDASKKLKGWIILRSTDEVEEIKFAGKYGSYYQYYKDLMGFQNPTYDMALNDLIFGLSECLKSEKSTASQVESNVIKNLKEKYYVELVNVFNISQSDADSIISLDSESKENKINELANRRDTQKKEQIAKDNKPIEFENLSWNSNSLYTIATGQIKNVSSNTIKFVKLKIAFQDSNENVIDTTSTYAVGDEGLAPGETTKWTASVKNDIKIMKYEVSVISFDK